MRKASCHSILDLDMFGYAVTLYSNRNHKKKHSYCGLVATVLMFSFGAIYAGLLAQRVGKSEFQTVQQFEYYINDLADQKEVSLGD